MTINESESKNNPIVSVFTGKIGISIGGGIAKMRSTLISI